MKKIFVLGQEDDPHILSVTKLLEEKNNRVYFFNYQNAENNGLAINYEHGKRNFRFGYHKIFNLNDIDAIWWRVKPSIFFTKKPSSKKLLWTEFAIREWRSFIESLDILLPQSFWVNPRISDFYASQKPRQLMLAQKLGFSIPPTLISNNPNEIVNFIKKHKNCIYKVLTWYFEPPNKLTFTNKIKVSDIEQTKESIKIAPGIFQKEIEKLYELRITVVGNKLFCAKIDSQSRKDTKIDWRRNQRNISYSNYIIPKNTAKLILKMNKILGLQYAAYDMIVTPKNNYYFLEVNPVGQWLWLEEILNLPITEAIADLLIEGKN